MKKSLVYLAKAAVISTHPLAPVGIAALLISALLTAIYMLSIVVRAFFPGKDFDYAAIEGYKDFDKNSPTAKVMYRQLNQRIKKVNKLIDEINAMYLGLRVAFRKQNRLNYKINLLSENNTEE